ncbi:MAG: glycosyltransferase, partial [Bacteroidota bacterium]
MPLYLLLAGAFGMKFLRLLHEWYHYANMGADETPPLRREWKVDMFTTFCAGEPYEMVQDTLRAMVAVKYPHQTYLCDEANDPYLQKVCAELGVIHVYRGPDKTDAKAGNINFALQQATGEIAVVLDPDHKPEPSFLHRVLPYFEDNKIGFVQCIQAYKNRNESLVAKGAAEQTYHFYGPMMMSMHRYGTVQAIGANCTFRRAALESIGGHAAGLSEDMHTAMQLHAKGWRSVYVPEPLTRGLVPATLSAYYKQQLKWSRGTLELLMRVFPRLIKGFSPRQILHYLSLPLHFLFGLVWLIDFLVPILSLFLARVPIMVELGALVLFAAPLVCLSLLIRQYAQNWVLEEHERGFHFLGGTLLVGSWWVFLVGLIYTLLRIKVPYIPTPKEDDLRNEWKLNIPNMLICLLSMGAILYGLSIDWNPYTWLMAAFAGTNVLILGTVILMGQQKRLEHLYQKLYGQGGLSKLRKGWYGFRHRLVYPLMRNSWVIFPVILAIMVATGVFWQQKATFHLHQLAPPIVKPSEGFYIGLESAFSSSQIPEGDAQLLVKSLEWEEPFPYAELSNEPIQGQVFIRWGAGPDPVTCWQEILEGKHDPYIDQMASQIRAWGVPAFLSWSPEADRYLEADTLDWASAIAYRDAFQHVNQRFRQAGVSTVLGVWETAGTDGYL